MSDDPAASAPAIRLGSRLVLWLHAVFWILFAGGMIALALSSPEPRDNPVFLQVLAASSMAAAGSIAAAFRRKWGAALALLGGLGVIAAWIAGNSGNEFRLPVGIALGIFAVFVAIEWRGFVSSGAR